MKGIFAAAVTMLLIGGTALAQSPQAVVITLDEFGTGTLQFDGLAPLDLPGVLAPDTGPGGLPSVLTYDLGGPPSVVAGDVGLYDANDGIVLDYIRFNPAGTGEDPNYPASALFYSDNLDGTDSLADTDGPPSSLYPNTVTIDEVSFGGYDGAWYHPGANDPGFVSGFDVTYNFISDVPEPGTVALLLGVTVPAGLLALRRRAR